MADGARTLVLKGEDAKRLERLVKRGKYKSPEAAVGQALAELESKLSLDEFLETVAAERYDRSVANPDRAMTLAQARKRLRGQR
jgi:hypothetical protein